MWTDAKIKALKPKEITYKKAITNILFIYVLPTGTKSFRLRWREGKKEKVKAIGIWPEMDLKAALEAQAEWDVPPDPGAPTFGEKAREFLKAQAPRRRPTYERDQWKRLEQNLGGLLNRPIEAITGPELLQHLRAIEARGVGTMADRMRILAGQVFKFASASMPGLQNIARDLGPALIPKPEVQHQPCIDVLDLEPLVKAVWNYDGDQITRTALKLLLHLPVRSKNLTDWQWSEIDERTQTWQLISVRMKQRREFEVPLSSHVQAILAELAETRRGSPYVLPSPACPTRPIAGNTLLLAFRRMEAAGFYPGKMSVHGVRALFGTTLVELGENGEHNFSVDVIRAALSHSLGKVWGAYQRSPLLKQRRELHEFWSAHITRLADGPI